MKRMMILLACLIAAHPARGQAPAGYHLGARVSLPDSSTEVWNDGAFKVTIARSARTPQERALIETAERLYPTAEKLLGSARTPAAREQLAGVASGVLPMTNGHTPRAAGARADRWWLYEFDRTWVPFAVTGGAVDYYAGRLRDIAAGRGSFSPLSGEKRDHGSVEYHAAVSRGSAPGVAYVVVMRLTWTYTCGGDCGMDFTATRIVSFDAAGNAVSITGDGRTSVSVS